MNWETFASIVCLLLLTAFIFFYEGVDNGIKGERKRILDKYDIKMK